MSYDLKFIDGLRTRLLMKSAEQPVLRGESDDDGENTMFAVDTSGSMHCDDYLPTRYLAGVNAAKKFIETRLNMGANDIIGAVLFEMEAHVINPGVKIGDAMTSIIKDLENLDMDGGTDINEGLLAANKCLASISRAGRRRVILLTDGNGGDPIRTASKMKDEGVIIDVVGIGGSRRDVNEECLMKVASIVGGEVRYHFIGDGYNLAEHFKNIATDLSIRR